MLERCGFTGKLAAMGGACVYLYGDYGVNPGRAPWFLHSMVATHYSNGGGFMPTGGCSVIAKTIVPPSKRLTRGRVV